jgi:hypothetical protein
MPIAAQLTILIPLALRAPILLLLIFDQQTDLKEEAGRQERVKALANRLAQAQNTGVAGEYNIL